MSNRVESTVPGDAMVMMNRSGYWALLMLDNVVFRRGLNGYKPIAVLRFVIAKARTASLTLADLSRSTA